MIVKGPAITPNQAVKANPPISLLIGFARTWANDQIKVPDRSINTPIILLTAKGEISDRIRGLELGADDYLGKPFEPKELLLRIKNIINKTKKFW